MNDSQPATTLQIRLADGSKLTGCFNLSQTVQDVKRQVLIICQNLLFAWWCDVEYVSASAK